MSVKKEDIWAQAEPLVTAWERYSDIENPGIDRLSQLRILSRGLASETVEEAKKRVRSAEQIEASLKIECLHSLTAKTLVAYGRDITSGLDGKIIQIPATVFDRSREGFSINWDQSTITALGFNIIDVRVVPAQTEPAISNDKSTSEVGRPNTHDRFVSAAEEAFKNDPKFCALPNRTEQAREIRARIFGEGARYQDDMAGCKIDSAKRWIGEAARRSK